MDDTAVKAFLAELTELCQRHQMVINVHGIAEQLMVCPDRGQIGGGYRIVEASPFNEGYCRIVQLPYVPHYARRDHPRKNARRRK